jgi:hypothetical protein
MAVAALTPESQPAQHRYKIRQRQRMPAAGTHGTAALYRQALQVLFVRLFLATFLVLFMNAPNISVNETAEDKTEHDQDGDYH